jgi:hypothetical protein
VHPPKTFCHHTVAGLTDLEASYEAGFDAAIRLSLLPPSQATPQDLGRAETGRGPKPRAQELAKFLQTEAFEGPHLIVDGHWGGNR